MMVKMLLLLLAAFLSYAFFIDMEWYHVRHNVLRGTWQRVYGTVSDVVVEPRSESRVKQNFKIYLDYKYEFNGKSYEGRDSESGTETHRVSDSMASIRTVSLKKFPLSKTLALKVNVSDPASSYVEQLHDKALLSVLIGCVLECVIVVAMIRMYRRQRAA